MDLWFAHYCGNLYAAPADPGKEPGGWALMVESVRDAIEFYSEEGRIEKVGICSPEMLGLEIEVPKTK